MQTGVSKIKSTIMHKLQKYVNGCAMFGCDVGSRWVPGGSGIVCNERTEKEKNNAFGIQWKSETGQ